jgi:hypothetical protein
MYKPLPVVTEALDELEARMKRERDGQRRLRLHLLVLLRSGAVRERLDAAAHLGLHEGTRRRLQSRGVKPQQRILPRYEYFWLYAAVDPLSGASLELELPALDVVCVQVFLDELAQQYPDSLNLLLWDGAPAHIAHALVVPCSVERLVWRAGCSDRALAVLGCFARSGCKTAQLHPVSRWEKVNGLWELIYNAPDNPIRKVGKRVRIRSLWSCLNILCNGSEARRLRT